MIGALNSTFSGISTVFELDRTVCSSDIGQSPHYLVQFHLFQCEITINQSINTMSIEIESFNQIHLTCFN